MMGTKITPSKESRLMTVIEMIPQIHAVGKKSIVNINMTYKPNSSKEQST